jgi:hypothetical protein
VHHRPHLCTPLQQGRRREREGKEKRKGEEEGSWKQRVENNKGKRRMMAKRVHGHIGLEKIKIHSI